MDTHSPRILPPISCRKLAPVIPLLDMVTTDHFRLTVDSLAIDHTQLALFDAEMISFKPIEGIILRVLRRGQLHPVLHYLNQLPVDGLHVLYNPPSQARRKAYLKTDCRSAGQHNSFVEDRSCLVGFSPNLSSLPVDLMTLRTIDPENGGR